MSPSGSTSLEQEYVKRKLTQLTEQNSPFSEWKKQKTKRKKDDHHHEK
jgi:hypothetical protein